MGYIPINIPSNTIVQSGTVALGGAGVKGAFNRCFQLKAFLDVTATAGGSETIDFVIQESLDGGTTWTDFIAFTQATGVTSETVTDADADVVAFAGDLRLKYTAAGTGAAVANSDPTGANNKTTWTSQLSTVAGNDIAFTIVEGDPGASLSVAVAAHEIAVTLAKAAAVQGVYQTNLTGSNNDLKFQARTAGVAGNSLHVAYIDPSANDAAQSITFDGTTLTVNLATGPAGAITSTGQQIMNAASAIPAVNAAFQIDLKSGNDGTGAVTALASQALATGADAAVTSTAGNVITAIAALPAAAALVVVTNFAGNDGTGLMTAMARQVLSNTFSCTYSLVGYGK